MTLHPSIDDTIAYATALHKGQRDQAGVPMNRAHEIIADDRPDRTRTPLSSDDLARMIEAMHDELRALRRAHESDRNVFLILAARLGDISHLSINEAAVALTRIRKRHISGATVKRMISRRELQLEQIPGTQNFGIPIEQIHAGWTDVKKLRTARLKEREEV